MSNVVTKDISAKLSYIVSTDLIDYAQSHDSDQAEALLDAVENNEDALELYKRAKAFFDLLVEQDILDPEDLEDMVGSPPDKATALLIKVSGKIEDPNEKLFLFLVNQNGKAQKIDKEINKKDLFSNNYLETRVVRMTQLSKGEYRIELRSSLTEAIEDQFTFAH